MSLREHATKIHICKNPNLTKTPNLQKSQSNKKSQFAKIKTTQRSQSAKIMTTRNLNENPFESPSSLWSLKKQQNKKHKKTKQMEKKVLGMQTKSHIEEKNG